MCRFTPLLSAFTATRATSNRNLIGWNLVDNLTRDELLRLPAPLNRRHPARDTFFLKLRFVYRADFGRLVFVFEKMATFVFA